MAISVYVGECVNGVGEEEEGKVWRDLSRRKGGSGRLEERCKCVRKEWKILCGVPGRGRAKRTRDEGRVKCRYCWVRCNGEA